MTVDTKTLRALATAATPGPRDVMEARTLNHVETSIDNPAGAGLPICSIPKARLADALFIAALSPDVALQMLDVLEAARAWAAVESETPQPSSTGVGDWAERRAAARDALLAAVEAAR